MTLHRASTDERIVAMSRLSRGWIGVVAADALLAIAALVFWTWPRALPIPNLDIIMMVIALVAVMLSILAFGVDRLNAVVDQNAS
jgi:hypothetical protein